LRDEEISKMTAMLQEDIIELKVVGASRSKHVMISKRENYR